jgi:phosphosulfolactate synthase
MNMTALTLPAREAKPRTHGLTAVLDGGIPPRLFEDMIDNAGSLIDLVKFGWGTSVVSDALDRKIACLRERQIEYYFGGTLFEKFLSQGRLDAYAQYCHRFGCRYVEISNGTIDLNNDDKARLITEFSNEFLVVSEVGYKDSSRSQQMTNDEWIEYIQQDLAAGATRVITEARESGTTGIADANGQARGDLIEDIIASGIDTGRVIFEAPRKELQVYFVRRLGPNVNLGNIQVADVIALETLRLGLRSDTLLTFE